MFSGTGFVAPFAFTCSRCSATPRRGPFASRRSSSRRRWRRCPGSSARSGDSLIAAALLDPDGGNRRRVRIRRRVFASPLSSLLTARSVSNAHASSTRAPCYGGRRTVHCQIDRYQGWGGWNQAGRNAPADRQPFRYSIRLSFSRRVFRSIFKICAALVLLPSTLARTLRM